MAITLVNHLGLSHILNLTKGNRKTVRISNRSPSQAFFSSTTKNKWKWMEIPLIFLTWDIPSSLQGTLVAETEFPVEQITS